MLICNGDAIQADYVWNAPAHVYEAKLVYYLKSIATEK
jgi:hypothetical protein